MRTRFTGPRVNFVRTIAALSVLLSPALAAAQGNPHVPLPVTVVSPVPLPVTGSIDIGTGGSVTVANPETAPVPIRNVDEQVREPFQAGAVFTAFSGTSVSILLTTVPANRRLVIEHVSASVNATAIGGLAAVRMSAGGSTNVDELPCVPMGQTANNLNHFFSCSAQTKFHASAGQTVSLGVETAGSGGFARGFISGYLVPVP
jgi:hypothetical protein